tara:strand:+ start:318 stop:560 length:243 start_codon:yes stop_codon:yes gene_type:complete
MAYNIIKFYQDVGKAAETIKRGLTLKAAQAYCSRQDTAGSGWFCGYQEADPVEQVHYPLDPANPYDDEPVDLHPLEGDER